MDDNFALCVVCLQDYSINDKVYEVVKAPVPHEEECRSILCGKCRKAMAGAKPAERLMLMQKAQSMGRQDALAAILDFYELKEIPDGTPEQQSNHRPVRPLVDRSAVVRQVRIENPRRRPHSPQSNNLKLDTKGTKVRPDRSQTVLL